MWVFRCEPERSRCVPELDPLGLLQSLLLAPVFEEILFRLYDKTVAYHSALGDRSFQCLVTDACDGSDPRAEAHMSPLSIPVWFALGLNVILGPDAFQVCQCILLHAFYNGAMLVGFTWLMSRWV